MPFFGDKGLLLAKLETTYGTDPVPTAAANAIAARNVSIRPNPVLVERKVLRDSISGLPHSVAGVVMGLTFECEFRASGAAGTAPKLGPVHRACFQSETVVAITSVTYVPISAVPDSVTFYFYADGILFKFLGARGNERIVERARDHASFAFDFVGLYSAISDAAIPAGAVFDALIEPPSAIALTLGGYSPLLRSVEIDYGNTTDIETDLNALDSIKRVWIPSRRAKANLELEAVTEATHPFWANFKAGTEVALGGNTIGATAGKKIQITAPKLQYEGPELSEIDARIRGYRIPCKLNSSTELLSDEVSKVYT